MTHDELLICVNMNAQTTGGLEQNTEALRAVVELHKPEIPSYCSDDTRCCDDECVICGESYPCRTIQAIEKELK